MVSIWYFFRREVERKLWEVLDIGLRMDRRVEVKRIIRSSLVCIFDRMCLFI